MTNATQGRELTLDLRTPREFLAQPLTPTRNFVQCSLCAWPSGLLLGWESLASSGIFFDSTQGTLWSTCTPAVSCCGGWAVPWLSWGFSGSVIFFDKLCL